jgi:hypothetical protein
LQPPAFITLPIAAQKKGCLYHAGAYRLGAFQTLPNPGHFVLMNIRKEAVLSGRWGRRLPTRLQAVRDAGDSVPECRPACRAGDGSRMEMGSSTQQTAK